MLGLWIAGRLINGFDINNTTALVEASFLLAICNIYLRPLLVILSLPVMIITWGLFMIVINAVLILFVATLLPNVEANGFGSALLAEW